MYFNLKITVFPNWKIKWWGNKTKLKTCYLSIYKDIFQLRKLTHVTQLLFTWQTDIVLNNVASTIKYAYFCKIVIKCDQSSFDKVPTKKKTHKCFNYWNCYITKSDDRLLSVDYYCTQTHLRLLLLSTKSTLSHQIYLKTVDTIGNCQRPVFSHISRYA